MDKLLDMESHLVTYISVIFFKITLVRVRNFSSRVDHKSLPKRKKNTILVSRFTEKLEIIENNRKYHEKSENNHVLGECKCQKSRLNRDWFFSFWEGPKTRFFAIISTFFMFCD